jgi:hypothetical protein
MSAPRKNCDGFRRIAARASFADARRRDDEFCGVGRRRFWNDQFGEARGTFNLRAAIPCIGSDVLVTDRTSEFEFAHENTLNIPRVANPDNAKISDFH